MIKQFNRFEIKYLIRDYEYREIIPLIKKYMQDDKYSSLKGSYKVVSLYFDTNDFLFYRNKIDGLLYRRKLRLRIYPEHSDNNAFFEIKQRINRTVQKRRIVVSLDKAVEIIKDPHKLNIDYFKEQFDKKVAEEILFMLKGVRVRPSMLIYYQREAYEGYKHEYGVRVTFDKLLKYRKRAIHDITDLNNYNIMLPHNIYVMEVKVNDKIPIWLSSLVSSYESSLYRLSKYCLGVSRYFSKLESKEIVGI